MIKNALRILFLCKLFKPINIFQYSSSRKCIWLLGSINLFCSNYSQPVVILALKAVLQCDLICNSGFLSFSNYIIEVYVCMCWLMASHRDCMHFQWRYYWMTSSSIFICLPGYSSGINMHSFRRIQSCDKYDDANDLELMVS